MRYRLYLYKTTAADSTAIAIGGINYSLSRDPYMRCNNDDALRFMLHFNAERIVRILEEELTDPNTNICRCRPMTRFLKPSRNSLEEAKEYVYVVTSYTQAEKVLPRIHAIAAENDLALYDLESRRTFYRELVDRPYITMQSRSHELNEIIRKQMKPLWSLRQIELFSGERGKGCAYAVTMIKDPQESFEDRNKQFYTLLKSSLGENEELICEDKCYKIRGRRYEMIYVLEGYKKHPNKIGYIKDDIPLTSLLHRMGADEAYRYMETYSEEEKNDVRDRMLMREMNLEYPNPADRFVESVKITKRQKMQIHDITDSIIMD